MVKYSLLEMLKWMRPEGSEAQKEFCKIYLEPVFGDPDEHGNYIKIVGDSPKVCFAAHHDTVHKQGGKQELTICGDKVKATNSNCLGADCTTGVWLILNMIQAKVPGVYVVHAGEEIGCVGSAALVKDYPSWLDQVNAVISFDRKGTESIITHQLGSRTCSDEFAVSLSKVLSMPQLRPDNTGSYTDSNEYACIVPECTNISVGYLRQHTPNEEQDMYYAYFLLERLKMADWSQLDIVRDPQLDTTYTRGWYSSRWDEEDWSNYRSQHDAGVYDIEDIVRDYPSELAELLHDWGLTAQDILEHIEGMNYTGTVKKVYANCEEAF